MAFAISSRKIKRLEHRWRLPVAAVAYALAIYAGWFIGMSRDAVTAFGFAIVLLALMGFVCLALTPSRSRR